MSHATALQQNAYLLFYVKNEHATPVKQEPAPSKAAFKSRDAADTPVKQSKSTQHMNGHSLLTSTPVNGDLNKSIGENQHSNGSELNGSQVTPVNREPMSIRGSGQWRVRDLSSLSTLLNDTPASEKIPVSEVKQCSVKSNDTVNVSPAPRVTSNKSPTHNQSNTINDVTRVKASVPQKRISVVEQLQTLGQSHGK